MNLKKMFKKKSPNDWDFAASSKLFVQFKNINLVHAYG